MPETPTEVISTSYRNFCRLACAALVLVGLGVIVFSIRVSGITCRRSEGICQTFHLGLLAGPGHTFPIKDVTGVGFTENNPVSPSDSGIVQFRIYDSCCSSSSYWPITYTWVRSTILLDPAADKIKHFLNDSSVPEVTIQVPDLRLNYLVIGIFFLSAGLIYAIANINAIRSGLSSSTGSVASHSEWSGSVSCAETLLDQKMSKDNPNTKISWKDIETWFRWVLTPFLCYFLILDLLIRILFSDLPMLAFGFAIIAGCAAQAWIIHDLLNGKGLFWLVSTLGSLAGLGWVSAEYTLNSHGLAAVLEQGRISPDGLILGMVIGLFQWLVLRGRLPHASWWVLGNALAGFCFSVLKIWEYTDLILILCYLMSMGITGFVLVWLLKQGQDRNYGASQ